MDFQTRKLNLISYLVQIQDEGFFTKIEKYILQKIKNKEVELTSFELEEFIDRIKKSEKDFENGNFKSQEELEKVSENW